MITATTAVVAMDKVLKIHSEVHYRVIVRIFSQILATPHNERDVPMVLKMRRKEAHIRS